MDTSGTSLNADELPMITNPEGIYVINDDDVDGVYVIDDDVRAEEPRLANGGVNDHRQDENEDEQTGVELTLDEAEDDPIPEETIQNIDDSGGSEKRCCGGLVYCCRRFDAEVRETCDELKTRTEDFRRRKPVNRDCALRVLKRQLPILQWLPRYNLKTLKCDVIAGITTGLSVWPQGLAYGQIVELPAVYGLYSSFMGSFVYAIFGTAKDVAVGPSAVVSILTAEYATGNSPILKDPTYAIILALFTGIILLAMGLLHLGFLFEYVSLPVLKGFRAAAGVTIFMSRIKKWWGLQGVPRDFMGQLYWTMKYLPQTNLYDLCIGTLCIFLLFFFKKLKAHKWKRRFQDLSIGLKIVKKIIWILGAERNIIVVSIGCAIVYGMLRYNIGISFTGPIQRGIPPFKTPNFTLVVPELNTTYYLSDIASEIGAGFFFVPMICMFEAISVGKAFGRKGNYVIDYNQELIAIGLSNILCAFVSGHPVTGAFLRSGINFNSGVKTPAAGILAACIVLLGLEFATPFYYYIPVCAMAATIMMGAIDVVTVHKVGILWKTKKIDLVYWLVTFIVSLTWGIQYGVFIGIALSLATFLHSSSRPRFKKTATENETIVFVVKPRVGLMFPAADYLMKKINEGIHNEAVKKVILDMSLVEETDTSIIQCLKLLHESLNKKTIQLCIFNSNPSVHRLLQRTTLSDFCTPAAQLNGVSEENRI